MFNVIIYVERIKRNVTYAIFQHNFLHRKTGRNNHYKQSDGQIHIIFLSL